MARGPELGAGPSYFRWQIDLPEPLPLDGVNGADIARLQAAGQPLVAARSAEIAAVAGALVG